MMKRAFEVDVLVCPHCGGGRKLIALITDPAVIRRILAHLKLPNDRGASKVAETTMADAHRGAQEFGM